MKKMLFLAMATVVFASCSKEYTCTCVDPETNEEDQMIYYTNKKSHATRLCEDWESRITTAIPTKSATTCSIK